MKGLILLSILTITFHGLVQQSNFRIQKGSQGEEVFMNYHEGTYLVQALQAQGFQLIHEDRITYASPDGSTTVDLILIAKMVG